MPAMLDQSCICVIYFEYCFRTERHLMVSNLTTASQAVGQMFDAVAKTQELAVGALTSAVDALADLKPVQAPELPVASVREVSDFSFGVAERVLNQQKALTLEVIAAAERLLVAQPAKPAATKAKTA